MNSNKQSQEEYEEKIREMQDGHDDAMQNAQQYYENQAQELYANLQESDK